MEQHPIKTADYGEIYVSFWDDGKDWSLQTEEEMGFEQTEDLSEEPGMSMTMWGELCTTEEKLKWWKKDTPKAQEYALTAWKTIHSRFHQAQKER